MEILTELFGAPGIAGAMGAIVIFFIKTTFSSLVKRSEKRTENKIELQSYKQKAFFDMRFKTYSNIYSKIKELEGTIKTFEDVYWISETKLESAFYSKVNLEFFKDLNEDELREIKMIYDVNPNGRCIINFNHFLELMSERKMDLNNYVSKEERILREEESLLFKELLEESEVLIEKIGQSFNDAYKGTYDGQKDSVKHCNKLAIRLDDRLKEYFMNDLSNLNNIIRDIDNKFREDLHT